MHELQNCEKALHVNSYVGIKTSNVREIEMHNL